jgi:hypothetical protein
MKGPEKLFCSVELSLASQALSYSLKPVWTFHQQNPGIYKSKATMSYFMVLASLTGIQSYATFAFKETKILIGERNESSHHIL